MHELAGKPCDYQCGRSVASISDEVVILSASVIPAVYQTECAHSVDRRPDKATQAR